VSEQGFFKIGVTIADFKDGGTMQEMREELIAVG